MRNVLSNMHIIAAVTVFLVGVSGCAGPFAGGASRYQDDPDELGTQGVYQTDFSEYRGIAATLPGGMFVTGENSAGAEIETSGYNPFTGVHVLPADEDAVDPGDPGEFFDGFGAYHDGDGEYSFGIRESGSVDLQNARLFLAYTNTLNRDITGFKVLFEVEAWYAGELDNRIRIKYNNATTGFSDVSELFSVVNPRADLSVEGSAPRFLDGTREENCTTAAFKFTLEERTNAYGPIPSLIPGQTGYFRWQFSNASVTIGSLRSALAIRSVRVEPTFD